MKLNLTKTLKSIEKHLSEETITIEGLRKAYDLTLRLRSQLVSVIYDIEQYVEPKKMQPEPVVEEVSRDTDKQVVKLVINEALPSSKELTAAVEEHWVNMIHNAIEEESKTGIPKFAKAFVMLHIITPRGTNNLLAWDVSNRAINVVINNLKGIFFKDDDFEHMGCITTAEWGEMGKTVIKICDYNKFCDENSDEIFNEMVDGS